MRVEAVLKNGHYEIPYLEKINFKKEHLVIEIDEKLLLDSVKESKSKTYLQLEKLNKDLGGNDLVEAIMEGMPKDYTYKQTKSDDDILFEALREKYEL